MEFPRGNRLLQIAIVFDVLLLGNYCSCSILRLNWLGSLSVIKSQLEALMLNIKFHLATLECSVMHAKLVLCISTRRCVQWPINCLFLLKAWINFFDPIYK